MREINEAELLDRLAEENKKLISKCSDLENENLNQLRRIERTNWIHKSTEISIYLMTGFCLGWWVMSPGAYSSGYTNGSDTWRQKYCESTTKTVKQYQQCL